MTSTNYTNTLITVADDCPVTGGQIAPAGTKKTVAAWQFDLISEHPYEFTSDDVLFEVHTRRHDIDDADRPAERERFFAKDQPCLRSSPLGKRYGWGIHHDSSGRIAVVPVGSAEYRALADDPAVTQVKAMRSKRA